MMLRTLFIALLLVMAQPAMAAPIKAVASFTILADMVRQVGGAGVDVIAIVGPNGDTHAYEPTPQDAINLSKAQLVFVNGLGLDGWIERLTRASGFAGKLLIATTGLVPRRLVEDGQDVPDPHAWQDLANAQIYLSNIVEALCAADAASCETFKSNAMAYQQSLDQLNAAMKTKFATLSAGQRQVVTTHDAFGYFAKAYDIRFLAPEGFATEAEPSAAAVARLVQFIKHDSIKALFFENMSDKRVIEAIAAETGIHPGPPLYADALSEPGGPADSYLKMFSYNGEVLFKAMAGK